MLKFVKSELFRIYRKKSNYIFYGLIMIAYYVILLLNAPTSQEILVGGFDVIGLIRLLGGVHIFIMVYCDDFSSKTVGNTLSTGLSRAKLVIGKLITAVIFSLIVVAVFGLVQMGVYFIYGGRFSSVDLEILGQLFTNLITTLLSMYGFMSLASVVAYETNSSVASISSYFLLVAGVVTNLLSLIKALEPVMKYTLTNLTPYTLVLSEVSMTYWLGVTCYIVLPTLLAIFVFNKKEIAV